MKKTLTIALLIAMIIGSCKESTRKEGAEKKNIETIENVSDGITKATSINQDGKKLEFLFNLKRGYDDNLKFKAFRIMIKYHVVKRL